MATERQQALLDAEDSRFHAIGPMGTGLAMIATSERWGKKVIGFGLPSAPALYLGAARNAHLERNRIDLNEVFVTHPHPQGTWPHDHGPLFNYFEAFAREVIFSFTALEAFANESVPADFVYEFKSNKRSALIKLNKAEIERRVTLDEKLKKVLPEAHGLRGPNGTKAWQDYRTLKETRDRLIHLKSIDRKSSGPEHQTVWGGMIEKQGVAFPDLAVRVIGHFQSLVAERRWFARYVPLQA